jgi:hypothetical protein
LVGVEDLGAAILRERLPHRIEAEVSRQPIGEPPGTATAVAVLSSFMTVTSH